VHPLFNVILSFQLKAPIGWKKMSSRSLMNVVGKKTTFFWRREDQLRAPIASGSYFPYNRSLSSSTSSSWLLCCSRSQQLVSNGRPRWKGTPAQFRLLMIDTPSMKPIPACNQG
jgi:hypothetical protein